MDIQEIRKENLRELSNRFGRAELADKLGYQDTNYLNQLCSGHSNIGNRTARKIEKALDLEHGKLDHPKIELVRASEPNESEQPTLTLLSILSQASPDLLEMLKADPSKVRASTKIKFHNNWDKSLEEALAGKDTAPDDWVTCDTATARNGAVATTMHGVSMASLSIPSIPSGARIIIKPIQKTPEDLPCLVFAKVHGDFTCRQLTREAGQYQLEPLNRDYKPTTFDPTQDKILGEVIGITTL